MAGKRTNRGRKKARRGAAPPRKQTELRAEDVAAEDIRLMRPGFEFPGRVATPDGESRMRHAYMVFEEGWRKRTDRSARAGLDALRGAGSLSDGPIEVPATYIEGDAAGVREFGDGKLRIMLSLPRGIDRETGRVVRIDDHIWLDVGELGGCESRRAEIRYGDVVDVAANVRAYRGKDGSRRLGVGTWWLVRSRFTYIDASCGRKRELKPIFGDGSLIMRAEFGEERGDLVRRELRVVESEALDAYLAGLAERWKSARLSVSAAPA